MYSVNSRLLFTIFSALYFLLAFCIPASVFPYRTIAMTVFSVCLLLVVDKRSLRIAKIGVSQASLFGVLLFFCLSEILAQGQILSIICSTIQYVCIAFSILSFQQNERSFTRFLTIMVICAFLGGPVVGLIQLITGTYLFPVVDAAYIENAYISNVICTAVLYNANYVAMNFVFILFMSTTLFRLTDNKFFLIVAFVTGISLMLTYSRTSYAAVVIALLALALARRKTRISRQEGLNLLELSLMRVLVVAAAICVLLVFLNYAMHSDVINHLFAEKDPEESIGSRQRQWVAILELIQHSDFVHMLLGYGSAYTSYAGAYSGRVMTAHNIFFGALGQGGIVCLILMVVCAVGMLSSVFCRYKNSVDKYQSVAIGALSLLICYQMVSAISIELVVTCFMLQSVYPFERENDES